MAQHEHDPASTTRKILKGDADSPQSTPGALSIELHRSFEPGVIIGGRYRVVRFIAQGGIGEVYEVEDQELGGRLALKTLQAGAARDDEARERFRREIQLARRVTHRNVCRIYEAGTHEGEAGPPQLFLTMELLRGETLEDRLRRDGPMRPSDILPILHQMANGLQAAHDCGVVHRDFKSSNVMLEPPDEAAGAGVGRVVVTDFGLARVVEDDEAVFRTVDTSGISGTVAFMAPEQVKDEVLTPAADLYALGVVLFQMLTGDLPFDTRSSISSLVRLLQDQAPAPSSKVPGLHRRWDEIVLRCLEKRPEDRFASAAEVAEAWEAGRRVRIPSRVRRRGLRVLAVLVAFGLLAGLTWQSRQDSTPSIEAGEPLQLTADAGLEIDPSLSPDGGRLAYASDRSGAFELYLRSFEPGAQDVQLTADGRRNMQPAWSPDGTRLAFVSQQEGGLWSIELSGDGAGEPVQLTDFGSRPAWSADGEWLAFQSDDRKEISERTLAGLTSTLWRVPSRGGAPEALTSGGEPDGGHGEPAWSPDGSWIAFSAGRRAATQIWFLEVETGELRQLVSEAEFSSNPIFGPDGRSLFYIGISDGAGLTSTFSVWRLGLDPKTGEAKGEAQKITRLGLASIRQMSLSSAMDRLIYTGLSTVSGLQQLAVDGEAGGEPAAWSRGGRRNSRPSFSLDGRRVAFDRWQMGGTLDIWVRAVDGNSQDRQLTVDPSGGSQASWLADGSLAYFWERDGKRGIWNFDPETGEHAHWVLLGADVDWARVTPDGRYVAYHSPEDAATLDVWVHDRERGESRRLTRDPELAGFPAWSPDGRRLAIELQRGNSTHVAVIPFEADGELIPADTIPILTPEPGDSWPYSWAPDNDRIAFAGRRGGLWNLYSVSASTGEVRQLTDGRNFDGYVRYPAWSPDGTMIVYEEARTVGDLWQVELTGGS